MIFHQNLRLPSNLNEQPDRSIVIEKNQEVPNFISLNKDEDDVEQLDNNNLW